VGTFDRQSSHTEHKRLRPKGFNRLATQILAIELDQVEGAKDCRRGPVSANEIEHRKAVVVGNDRLTVDQAGSHRQFGDGCRGEREAIGEVVAPAGVQGDDGGVALREYAEPVVLDFVNPTRPRRAASWQGGANKGRCASNGAATHATRTCEPKIRAVARESCRVAASAFGSARLPRKAPVDARVL
jgi:hypothetical protein